MPEFSTAFALIVGGSLLRGAIIGWLLRGVRAEQQRLAINAEWSEQLDALQRSEKRTNKARKELSAELAKVTTELNALKSADPTQNTKALLDDNPPSDAQADFVARLEESYAKRDSLRQQLTNLITKSTELAQASKQKDEKIFALSRELESWQHRLPPLIDRFKEKDHQNTVILEQLEAERQRAAELSNTLKTRIMPATWHEYGTDTPASNAEEAGDYGDDRDDLKRIRGVGPVLEKTLNALGIYRFSQIASFGASDIQRISDKLPQFPGRIERDRWIEQARDLSQ